MGAAVSPIGLDGSFAISVSGEGVAGVQQWTVERFLERDRANPQFWRSTGLSLDDYGYLLGRCRAFVDGSLDKTAMRAAEEEHLSEGLRIAAERERLDDALYRKMSPAQELRWTLAHALAHLHGDTVGDGAVMDVYGADADAIIDAFMAWLLRPQMPREMANWMRAAMPFEEEDDAPPVKVLAVAAIAAMVAKMKGVGDA